MCKIPFCTEAFLLRPLERKEGSESRRMRNGVRNERDEGRKGGTDMKRQKDRTESDIRRDANLRAGNKTSRDRQEMW